ncbi:MAG: class I SAM-dependent methyltransferase [Candidatus Nitrosotenuis sp.]|jgi:ubiquinone/menaquinone biosynthesis C-methylase UbiE
MSALDLQYWNDYAENHQDHYNGEMAKFICDLATSLRAQSVLEVGCSAGNDLRLFPEGFDVSGVDYSEIAITKAKENLPGFGFKIGSADSIPFADSSADFVFTRNLFNHLDSKDVKKVIDELFRVSKKYILNIELFSENEEYLGSNPITYGRNMKKHWMNYKVKIISNVDMHEEIDPKKSRFTLLRKM